MVFLSSRVWELCTGSGSSWPWWTACWVPRLHRLCGNIRHAADFLSYILTAVWRLFPLKGSDVSELEKHIYADSIEPAAVRSLLSMIYLPCKCQMLADAVGEGKASTDVCPGHERVLSLQTTIERLNITEQGACPPDYTLYCNILALQNICEHTRTF